MQSGLLEPTPDSRPKAGPATLWWTAVGASVCRAATKCWSCFTCGLRTRQRGSQKARHAAPPPSFIAPIGCGVAVEWDDPSTGATWTMAARDDKAFDRAVYARATCATLHVAYYADETIVSIEDAAAFAMARGAPARAVAAADRSQTKVLMSHRRGRTATRILSMTGEARRKGAVNVARQLLASRSALADAGWYDAGLSLLRVRLERGHVRIYGTGGVRPGVFSDRVQRASAAALCAAVWPLFSDDPAALDEMPARLRAVLPPELCAGYERLVFSKMIGPPDPDEDDEVVLLSRMV